MHTRSYDTSSLFKIFPPYLNTLNYLGASFVTEDFSYSISLFASFFLLIPHSDSSFSVKHSLTMMPFDSSSSVEKLYDKVLLTGNFFNLLSSVEKTGEVGI